MADDPRLYPAAFRPAQQFRHVDLFDADRAFAVHRDDPVVGEQAHLFGGTARNDVDHDDRIAQYVEFDADAAETAVEALLDFDHLLGRYVSRMRVELQQHFADRAFDQRIVVYRIDVGAVQVTVELLEFLQVAGRIVFRVVLCRNKRRRREQQRR